MKIFGQGESIATSGSASTGTHADGQRPGEAHGQPEPVEHAHSGYGAMRAHGVVRGDYQIMNSGNPTSVSRRGILRVAASIGALGFAGSLARAGMPSPNRITLEKGSVILFQGDSITDAGRKKEVHDPNNGKALGAGYAAMISGEILLAHNDRELKCYNRGISGNKVPDLIGRWDQDTVALKPDILSIMKMPSQEIANPLIQR